MTTELSPIAEKIAARIEARGGKDASVCCAEDGYEYLLRCHYFSDVIEFLRRGYPLRQIKDDDFELQQGRMRPGTPFLSPAYEEDELESFKELVDMRPGFRFVEVRDSRVNPIEREALLYAFRKGLLPASKGETRLESDADGPFEKPFAVQEGFRSIARTFDAELIDAAACAIEESCFQPAVHLDSRLGTIRGREDLAELLTRHSSMVDPTVITQGELWYGRRFSSIAIPEGVEVIEPKAFRLSGPNNEFDAARAALGLPAKPIEAVSFPDTLHTIGRRAFEGHKIEKVRLPKSLKTIGKNSFFGAQEIAIYDLANQKSTPKRKADRVHKSYVTQIAGMNAGFDHQKSSYDIVVLDMETDEVKFRLNMPLSQMSQYGAKHLGEMWMNTATFRFFELDAEWSHLLPNAASKTRAAFYRLAYPLELEEASRECYVEFLKDSERAVDRLVRMLLVDGDIEAVRRFGESIPMTKDQAARHLKAIKKDKSIGDEIKDKCRVYLESVIG